MGCLLIDHGSLLWIFVVVILGVVLLHLGLVLAKGESIPSNRRVGHRQAPYKRVHSARSKGNSDGGGGDTDADGHDGVGSRESKRGSTATTEAEAGPLFACPCWKFNPIKFTGCLERNRIKSTSFVVQHLLRSHALQPIHCPTCGETFPARENFNEHVVRRTCEPRVFHHDGLTEDQVAQLKSRSRGASNDVDRWFSIWDILYPNTERPNSPYVSCTMQENLSIARRALRAAGASFEILTAEGNRPWDWDYLLSLIPDQEDLSYLTSDRPTAYVLNSPNNTVDASRIHAHQLQLLSPQRQQYRPDTPQSLPGSNQLNHMGPVGPFIEPRLLTYGDHHSFPLYAESATSPISSLLHQTTSQTTAANSFLREERGSSRLFPATALDSSPETNSEDYSSFSQRRL